MRRRSLLALPALLSTNALAAGSSRIELPEPSGATADPLPVWLHRPSGWAPGGPVAAVLHGLSRAADRYRDAWAPLADRHGFLLAVPEFAARKYPGVAWYNYGGAVDSAGQGRPRAEWSCFALDRAMAAVAEGPFALYGHSAGAQFAHRYLLLTGAPRVGRLIIANAGAFTLPLPDRPFPEGLGGLAPVDLAAAYRRPVTIALGEADTDPDHPALPKQPWAMAQGPHRFARGQAFFALARQEAARLATPFGWEEVTVPGIGHSNAGMAAALAATLAATLATRLPG